MGRRSEGSGSFSPASSSREGLVEDDERGLLALAHLRPPLLPLAVGAPEPLGVAAVRGGGPQGDGVDAAVGVARGDVLRARDGAAARVPGHLEGARALFDGDDDLVGDGFVKVEAGTDTGGHAASPRLTRGRGRVGRRGNTPRPAPALPSPCSPFLRGARSRTDGSPAGRGRERRSLRLSFGIARRGTRAGRARCDARPARHSRGRGKNGAFGGAGVPRVTATWPPRACRAGGRRRRRGQARSGPRAGACR